MECCSFLCVMSHAETLPGSVAAATLRQLDWDVPRKLTCQGVHCRLMTGCSVTHWLIPYLVPGRSSDLNYPIKAEHWVEALVKAGISLASAPNQRTSEKPSRCCSLTADDAKEYRSQKLFLPTWHRLHWSTMAESCQIHPNLEQIAFADPWHWYWNGQNVGGMLQVGFCLDWEQRHRW